MGKRLKITAHLEVGELEHRYRKAQDGVARSQGQIIWLMASGKGSKEVAEMTGYSRPWIRQVVKRYNEQGEAALGDHRHQNPGRRLKLTEQQQAELQQALAGKAPDGGVWTGSKVAVWMSEKVGRPVYPQRGWEMLRRLGYRSQTPRRRHAKADAEQQDLFKKTSKR
jgi:transposase